MGTLKVLSPEMLSSLPGNFGYPPDIADAENAGEAEVWVLVAMWVRPTSRGRGVGRDLVEKALEVGQRLEADHQCSVANERV